MVISGFKRVLPRFTGFYWVLLGLLDIVRGVKSTFIEFHRVYRVLSKFYWVLLGFLWFYLVFLGFTSFFSGFNLVLPHFTGFYWVLLGFTGFIGFEVCLPSCLIFALWVPS